MEIDITDGKSREVGAECLRTGKCNHSGVGRWVMRGAGDMFGFNKHRNHAAVAHARGLEVTWDISH